MARKKNSKAKTSSANSQAVVLSIVIIVIIFIGLVSLLEWGALGRLVNRTFRLVIGDVATFLSFYLVVELITHLFTKDNSIHAWARLIGAFCLFLGLSLLFHIKAFYPEHIMSDRSGISRTFNLFKRELVLSNKLQLGGGILGASLYYVCGVAFGYQGSYAFSILLILLGLILILRLSLSDIFKAVAAFFSDIKGLFNSFKKDKVEEVPAAEVAEEIEQAEEKEKPKKGLRNTFLSLFAQGFEEDEPQASYKPTYKEQKSEFKTFTRNDKKNQLTPSKHQLDPDYFDLKYRTNKRSEVPIQTSQRKPTPKPVEEVPITGTELNLDTFSENITKPKSKPVIEKIEKTEIPVQETKIPVQKTNTNEQEGASHWLEQQDNVESLTGQGVVPDTTGKKKTIKPKKHSTYQLPTIDLLDEREPVDQSEEYERINENIDKLEMTFESFGVSAKVVKANLGPSVTKYEIEPGVGVKVSRIVSLADDIALALAARDVRIEAPIPGKSLIGIEVPNQQVSPVYFRDVIEPALNSDELLEVPLGRDISGSVALADLSKMPHLLIAGATGSGKSVGMNVIISSLLMKAKPEELKFLMIDPKKVELTMYNEIPHLLSPVVTNPRKAAQALNKIVKEMEERYDKFALIGVRNVDGFNDAVDSYNKKHGTAYEKLPKIVVFIDELADLMLVASNEVETAITRLAQMARAAGIHMIIATQRPSVDVITGIIKANIPSRLAFAVSSGTDSRTILDSSGAEKLLGRGDMLFQPMGRSKPIRVQGAYISDEEVERITDFIKAQRGPEYDEDIIVTEEEMEIEQASDDEYFQDAIELIRGLETVSISQLQRHFRIGYNRAARLVDDLEAMGYVSEPDGSKPRDVLIND